MGPQFTVCVLSERKNSSKITRNFINNVLFHLFFEGIKKPLLRSRIARFTPMCLLWTSYSIFVEHSTSNVLT